MRKIWFILIDGQKEGPYSVNDLKKDLRITPDTLVWKEGFTYWKQICEVQELKFLFKDKDEPPTDEEETKKPKPPTHGALVLEMREEPPNFFWILAVVIIIAYFLYYLLTQLFLS